MKKILTIFYIFLIIPSIAFSKNFVELKAEEEKYIAEHPEVKKAQAEEAETEKIKELNKPVEEKKTEAVKVEKKLTDKEIEAAYKVKALTTYTVSDLNKMNINEISNYMGTN